MSGELIKSVKPPLPVKGLPGKSKHSEKEKLQTPTDKDKPVKDKKRIIDTYV
ncbi:MAG: hypothetical protein ACI845_002867 [Gammaproteobacteria bacterium]|jgi:hypothetical protein